MNETLLHCLMTFGISMVPVIELRGAIPYGLAFGLPLPLVLIVSVLGNMVPVPFIALFIRKIFAWLRTKSQWLDSLVTKLEARAHEKGKTVQKYKISFNKTRNKNFQFSVAETCLGASLRQQKIVRRYGFW